MVYITTARSVLSPSDRFRTLLFFVVTIVLLLNIDSAYANTEYYPAKTQTSKPIIAFIHGGGWTMGDISQTRPWAIIFNNKGYATINIDYRLASDTVTARRVVGDVYSSIRLAKADHGILNTSSTKVVAVGFSAGGHLAALSASTGVSDGAVGFSAPIKLSNALNTPLWSYARTFVGTGGDYNMWSVNNYYKNRSRINLFYAQGELMVPYRLHGRFMRGARVKIIPSVEHSSGDINGWERLHVFEAVNRAGYSF